MRITRRSLLVGAGSGAVALLLASCVPTEPDPTPTPTEPDVTPTPSHDVPVPVAYVRSGWTTDPLARGARPYVPAGSGAADRAVLAEPLEDRVFFAGDALGDPIGTMHGAANDGLRAAELVAASGAEGERVFVVGAGIAGARAARYLADRGFEVTVIEGRNRVGGRIESPSHDDWPVNTALGMWLANPDDTDLLESLDDVGIRTIPLEGETARDQQGDADPIAIDAVREALDAAAEAASDASLEDQLAEDGADIEAPDVAAALAYVSALTGAEAAELSSWYPPQIPDGLVALDGDLAEVVTEALGDITMSLETTVLGVAYDDRGVSLRLGSGEALSADRVVLTVPIGVLRQGSISFEPALPIPHRAAIDAIGSGAVETIWLQFDESFWQNDETLWHVVGGEALVRTWVNLLPITGEPILVGLVGADAAREFAELSDGEAAQAAVDSLGYFAAAPTGEE